MGKPGTRVRRLKGWWIGRVWHAACYMQGAHTASGKLLFAHRLPIPVTSLPGPQTISCPQFQGWLDFCVAHWLLHMDTATECFSLRWLLCPLGLGGGSPRCRTAASTFYPQTQPGCSMPLSCFVLSLTVLTFFLSPDVERPNPFAAKENMHKFDGRIDINVLFHPGKNIILLSNALGTG